MNIDHMNDMDALGTVLAAKKVLDKQEKELKAKMIARGVGRFEGDLFGVTVSEFDKTTTAWKKIAEKLEASRQIINGNSVTKTQNKVTVNSL